MSYLRLLGSQKIFISPLFFYFYDVFLTFMQKLIWFFFGFYRFIHPFWCAFLIDPVQYLIGQILVPKNCHFSLWEDQKIAYFDDFWQFLWKKQTFFKISTQIPMFCEKWLFCHYDCYFWKNFLNWTKIIYIRVPFDSKIIKKHPFFDPPTS